MVATLLIVAILAGAGVGYLLGYNNRQTVTMTMVSFSYSPRGQVVVDKVWATTTPARNGEENVTFWVTFGNTGNAPVYAIGGWVSALDASISGNSTVIQTAPSRLCVAAIYLVTLNHGQNTTVFAPDCASGFNYQLVHAGNVAMVLSFNWSTNLEETTPFSNSTTIQANFIFS